MLSDHRDNFLVARHIDMMETLHKAYHKIEIAQVPHRNLPNDMRMCADLTLVD